MDSNAICAWLSEHGIAHQRFFHPAVNTCEEAERLLPDIEGVGTKNLFLRDEKGKRHFLVITTTTKSVALKALGMQLGVKLSFASPERLLRFLGVLPGSVTVLGLINDHEQKVEVYIDEEIWSASAIHAHPLVNTETVLIGNEGVRAFFRVLKREPRVIALPVTSEEMPQKKAL